MEGPEKIDQYVTQAVSKFVLANGYSEVPIDKMKESFRLYLIREYNLEINALSTQLQYEQSQGIPINRDWYQNEVGKIRAKFLMKVEQISWMG